MAALLRGRELEGSVDDPRFATNPARVANFGATIALVQDVLRTRSCDEWVAALIAAGIPCAPINTLQDALDNPHTADRGIVLDYEHPELGALKTIAHPVTFDGARARCDRRRLCSARTATNSARDRI